MKPELKARILNLIATAELDPERRSTKDLESGGFSIQRGYDRIQFVKQGPKWFEVYGVDILEAYDKRHDELTRKRASELDDANEARIAEVMG
jgi:hypothetical protein